MRVSGGSLDLTVAEELADHRQAFARGGSSGRVGMPEIMFVSGRRRGDFFDPPHVRTHAQSRADIGSLPPC